MQNLLLVISGPSGVGKGTIAKELLSKQKDLDLSVSLTTRDKRVGEIEGVHYFFVPRDVFKNKLENGELLEYSEHFGSYYGTSKTFVESTLSKGRDVLLEIDVNGALNVKKAFPEAVLIMITPPNREELEKRLKGRGTETADKIKTRLERVDYELGKAGEFDYTVVNDKLDKAIIDIQTIIKNKKEK